MLYKFHLAGSLVGVVLVLLVAALRHAQRFVNPTQLVTRVADRDTDR